MTILPSKRTATSSRPETEGDWTRRHACHLARRAGFGARDDELDHLVTIGREAAVASFLDLAEPDEALEAELRIAGGELADPEAEQVFIAVARHRDLWMYRMVRTRQPLREKLALMWHDHFACQFSKLLRSQLYAGQVDLFRRLGSGSFRKLLHAVAADPGMLVYLDNRLNVAANPNENWARELLELFSLGVDRYTQRDVVEAARIFTGWTTPHENTAEFLFLPETHDTGAKVFLGHKIRGRSGEEGIEEGRQALDAVLDRLECSEFVARKLHEWFVSHEPDPERVHETAGVLVQYDMSIAKALASIFLADWFYEPELELARVKNPVEWAVSAARLLGVANPHLLGLPHATRAAGMELYEPPSVAGWDQGEAWIHSGAVIANLDLALKLSELPHSRRKVTGSPVWNVDAVAADADEPADIVDRVADVLLQRPLEGRSRAGVIEAVSAHEAIGDERALRRVRTRAAVHLVLASPQFVLC